MSKHLICLCILLSLFAGLNAQKITKTVYSDNPFRHLEFNNGPTDTITVTAIYSGVLGPLSEKNADALEVVNKLNGVNVKKFKYAIGFTLDGYPQNFYAPCADKNMYSTLGTGKATAKTLRLKCVVYRFYTLDGVTNFFYIDKAWVADKSI